MIKLCFIQSLSKLIAHDRFKSFFIKKKYHEYLASVLGITSSAFFTGIISYPFDLAYARVSGSTKQISNYLNTGFSNWKILLYYDAFIYAMIENTINGALILATYYSIKNSFTSTSLFAASSLAAVTSSILTYPLNTLKRQAQVAKFGGNFTDIQLSFKDILKNIKPLYK